VAIKATLFFLFCTTNCAAIDSPYLWKTRHKPMISRNKPRSTCFMSHIRWGLMQIPGISSVMHSTHK